MVAGALAKFDLAGEWVFTNSGRGRRGDNGPVRGRTSIPTCGARR